MFFFISIVWGCAPLTVPDRMQASKDSEASGVPEVSEAVESATAEGWKALWENDFDEAERLFGKALQEAAEYVPALRGMGLAKFSIAREFQAFDYLNRAVRNAPADPLAIPVRDFLGNSITFSKSGGQSLKTTNWKISKDVSAPLWNRREALLVLGENYVEHEKDIPSARRAYAQLKFERDWDVLGPFPNISHSGFDEPFIDESNISISLREKEYTGMNNRVIEWFHPIRKNYDGWVPLADYLDYPVPCAAYACSYVDIAEEGKHVLVLSQIGAVKCWVDGELVISDANYEIAVESHWVMLDLSKGTHTILVKVCNEDNPELRFQVSMAHLSPGETEKFNRVKGSRFYGEIFADRNTDLGMELPDPLLSGICGLIDSDPDNLENYFWLSYMLHVKGYGLEGVEVLDRALERQRKSVGMTTQDAESKSTAEKGSALLHIARRWCYLREDKASEARTATHLAAEIAPGFSPAAKPVIDEMIERKSLKRAEMLLNEMFLRNPLWFDGFLSKMVLLLQQGKPDESFILIDELNELYPDVPAVYSLLSLKAEIFNLEALVPVLMEEMGKGGYPYEAVSYFMKRSFGERNYHRAGKLAEELIAAYPTTTDYHVAAIESKLRMTDDFADEAVQIIRELLLSFPYSLDLLSIELRLLDRQVYNLKRIISENESVLAANPTLKVEYEGKLEEKSSDLEKVLEKILAINPKLYSIRNQLRTLREQVSLDDLVPPFESVDIISEFEEKMNGEGSTGVDGAEVWAGGGRRSVADYIVVLKDVTEFYFDDSGRRKYSHRVFKVLSQKGVETLNTLTIPYHPYFSDLEFLQAHVIKEDGSQIQAVSMLNKLSFPGLEKGDYIEIEYTEDSYRPGALNKEFWTAFRLNSDVPVFKARFSVLYPRKKEILTRMYNSRGITGTSIETPAPQFKTVNDEFKLCSIHADLLDALKSEALPPDPNDLYCWIDISTLAEWSEIQSWYSSLYEGQCEVTPKIRKKVDDLLVDTEFDEDKIEVLCDFVARRIEYEDLDFQYSAYIPQKAESVLEDGYGDCKDKCTLLITMLKAAGIPSYIALSEPDYTGDSFYLPSTRFSHTFVIVPRGETFLALDPTAAYYTYPEIPYELKNTYYLPVEPRTDETSEPRKDATQYGARPYRPAGEGRFESPSPERLRVSCDAEGVETGTMVEMVVELQGNGRDSNISGEIVCRGTTAVMYRTLLKTSEESRRKNAFSGLMNYWVHGFDLDILEVENMETLLHPPVVRFEGSMSGLITGHSNRIAGLNLPWLVRNSSTLTEAVGESERENPLLIDIPHMSTPRVQKTVLRLPSRFKVVSLPADQTFELHGIEASFTYKKIGNTITCTRRFLIPKTEIAVADYPKLRELILQITSKEKEQVLVK